MRVSNEGYIAEVLDHIEWLRMHRRAITTDDIHERMAETDRQFMPTDLRVLGLALRAAEKERMIVRTPQFVISRHGVNNRRPVRVWKTRKVK